VFQFHLLPDTPVARQIKFVELIAIKESLFIFSTCQIIDHPPSPRRHCHAHQVGEGPDRKMWETSSMRAERGRLGQGRDIPQNQVSQRVVGW
jgi:hypothetical protein